MSAPVVFKTDSLKSRLTGIGHAIHRLITLLSGTLNVNVTNTSQVVAGTVNASQYGAWEVTVLNQAPPDINVSMHNFRANFIGRLT